MLYRRTPFLQHVKNISTIMAVIAMLAFSLGYAKGTLDLPTVYKSVRTGKVVKIESPTGVITHPSPTEIPEKYHLIWVK